MSKKKLMWIFILIVFVFIIVGIAIFVKPRDASNDNFITVKKQNSSEKDVNSESKENNTNNEEDTDTSSTKKTYIRTVLDDGILYSENGQKLTSDEIIGTEYFDTTINDMYLYPENYSGKNIEIEGLYLAAAPDTFIGRYSATSVCPYCSGGFSYIQYEFDGDVQEKLTEQETWIKLIGTWEKGTRNYGTEENPYSYDYYYIKVLNFEIMNEKGEDTVKN